MKKNNRLLKVFTMFFFSALAAPAVFGDESDQQAKPVIIHATGNYHAEARDYVGYADGFDILVGVDFLLWEGAGLYAGPRLGWYAETVCTAYMSGSLAMRQKPSFGGQIYFFMPLPFFKPLGGALGAAIDVLVNLDNLHSSPGERLYLFASAFAGARFIISNTVHLEARLEAGIFPFFNSPPVFIKAGLQVGVHL
jgi:hypothetical protein